MQSHFSAAAILLASGIMSLGTAQGQQTPAANANQSTSTKAQSSASKPATRRPAASGTQSALVLKTQKDKASYAIGMNIGTNLHRQSVDIDPAILERGIKDALTGSKPLLTEDEAKTVLTDLQTQMRQQEQQKLLVEAQANKKEGDAFLAANKTKQGVVTLPSGLQYKILQQGTGVKPTASDNVVINYRGRLVNGTEFDSSFKRGQPVTFPAGRVIKGLSEALLMMPVGSKWQLYIPAELAYGERGAGGDIGPNSTIIFDVDLLSIAKNQPPAQPGSPSGNNQPSAIPQSSIQNQQKTPANETKTATNR